MVFRVFWLSIKDLFDELFTLIGINVLWILVNLPLLGIALLLLFAGSTVFGAMMLLIATLTFGPANAGLYLAAAKVVEGRTISVRDFFDGFREQRGLSWRIYGVWMAGLVLIGVNLSFYTTLQSTIGSILTLAFIYILLVWFAVLIYLGPLMLLQEDKRIRIVYRNAFLMALGRPIFTLVTAVLMLVIILLSVALTILPFIITFAFLALWGQRATLKLVKDAEDRRAALDEKQGTPKPAGPTERRSGQIRPRE